MTVNSCIKNLGTITMAFWAIRINFRKFKPYLEISSLTHKSLPQIFQKPQESCQYSLPDLYGKPYICGIWSHMCLYAFQKIS